METLLAMNVVFGLLLCGLAVPMIRNKVRPNPIYGVRIPRTLNNPKVWYAANHFAGRRLLVTGAATVIAAIALYFVPGITLDSYSWGILAVFGTLFAIMIIQLWLFLRKLPNN